MKHAIIVLSLILTAAAMATENIPQRGRISRAYHNTYSHLSDHKGKVGFAAGAIGTGLILRVFNKEINDYVKPLIKSVWNRTTGWFKRIFRSEKK